MGALLAAIGADTLPLPVSRPATYVVWRFDGTVRITTNDKQGTGSAPVS